ncbi:hypothetical protein P872_19340 [Rhodonellum psychrophilum GCM71 = DSM 17998]|uniref:Uncharacterized protein n=2 Tax=Rhodonellum TaxID=336827 RepID=U5C0N4_9BACT|nr:MULTISPECIES: hypothetical protein [Rhodonellum]ERM81742.1 hypothetical protein P872_19340 [Rhodonellum psychrophilum GCM71 = DSM 17998]SDZ55927.1 Peptide chain release factor 1 (eRF1) [Rhodonellum ikkaensis]
MKLLTEKLIQELLNVNEELCLSLYMPTHRSHPENLQDPIRFNNLIKELEKSILTKYSTTETTTHLEPLKKLAEDADFWNHTTEGLAVLSTNGRFEVIKLKVSVEELAIAADSFHTKPLRKYLQSTDRFHVLGVSHHDIQLFEGNRHSLDPIVLSEDVPATIEDALGDELTDKHTTVASYGGSGGESSNMHHGHGGKKEEMDLDAERFFRVIGKSIYENYSRPTGLPLILAALPEHHHQFHEVNINPLLLEKGITVNPKSVSKEILAQRAWEVMEPEYLKRLKNTVDRFEQERANGKGSDDYIEVAIAAVEGRIDTLLVEADRVIAVRITNLVTGNTQKKDLDNPRVDDLLDDMGELVMKMGGKVIVVPTESMPSETGLAAIYRY